MKLNLDRPVVFFDLETTGINANTDRIVEISLLKVFPNGNKESKTWLVNPGIKIPANTSEIHGITDEKVKDEPLFKELAPKVSEIIKGCDLGGFNSNRFDIPLLAEEMLRAEQEFDMTGVKTVDVQVIFHKKEQRTLSAGYQFYCGKDLEMAHSAEADTMATYEILLAQLEKYEDVENDMDFLNTFSKQKDNVDLAGFIVKNDQGEPVFSFGKNKGIKVLDVFKKTPGYYSWMQNSDFPLYTKRVLKKIKEDNQAVNKNKTTIDDLMNKFNNKI
ncbi:MAG: 3'-5' exonuclease [Flavobacteriaceae bacterium]|nr:3'-5' exonuclease [Flavobacteriaceae bacterium]